MADTAASMTEQLRKLARSESMEVPIVVPMLTRQASLIASQEATLLAPKPSLMRAISAPGSAQATMFTCVVCYEDTTTPAAPHCTKETCRAKTMCLNCSSRVLKDAVAERRYMIAPIKCIHCNCPVATQVWAPAARTEYQDYVTNLERLFSIRCTGCEEDASFFVFDDKRDLLLQRESLVQASQQLAEIITGPGTARVTDAVEMLLSYSNTEAAANLISVIETETSAELARQILLIPRVTSDYADTLSKAEGSTLGLIYRLLPDVERRALVLNVVLRRQNGVVTPCCSMDVCFRCKYDGTAHATEAECTATIEKRRIEADSDRTNDETFINCPECLVGIVHAGGCSSMRCLCGHMFDVFEVLGAEN